LTCYNCDTKIKPGNYYTVFKNPDTEEEVVVCEDCVMNARLIQTEEEE
jgi:predicted RNA-binding Zn-ribbon protein involved in translation (DUF1610 family)